MDAATDRKASAPRARPPRVMEGFIRLLDSRRRSYYAGPAFFRFAPPFAGFIFDFSRAAIVALTFFPTDAFARPIGPGPRFGGRTDPRIACSSAAAARDA